MLSKEKSNALSFYLYQCTVYSRQRKCSSNR